jgi:hypothetical protein
MFSAKPAVLFHFQPVRRSFFVLGRAIVLPLALGALQMNNVAHNTLLTR